MDIEIIETINNPAFHRKEIHFIIRHLGEGTPNRMDVRDKLVALETSDPNLTFIMEMKPRFGIPEVHGIARVYEDEKTAKQIELSHIKIRNMPKDQREDAWKAIKAKRKK